MKQSKTLSFEKHLNIKLDSIPPCIKSIPKNNISLIKIKNKEKKDTVENENKKNSNTNIFLTENNLSRSLGKIFKNKNKIKLIKHLLTPTIKDFFFDGYAVNRKKYSLKELINKTNKKEKKEMLEKNILFKCPYPLIKFLSNRKLYNNSTSLIAELLDNDSSKLTKVQLLTINNIVEDNIKNNLNTKKSYIKNMFINRSNKYNSGIYPNNLYNSYNYLYDKHNTAFNYKKEKYKKKINLKRNIRLYDYLSTKYNLSKYNGTKASVNNKFLNSKTNHVNLPFLTKYMNDKVETDKINTIKLKNQTTNINRTENTVYLNDELINFQLNTFHFNNNNISIIHEENENRQNRSLSNSIIIKNHKKYVSKKI